MALSSQTIAPEIKDALFQCRLSLNEYFTLMDQASTKSSAPSEQDINQSLFKAREGISRKISKSNYAQTLSYKNQLTSCYRKTHSPKESLHYYLYIKREHPDLDCQAKLLGSNLKKQEVKALCQGAKFFAPTSPGMRR